MLDPSFPEFASIAGRAAKVHLQNSVAAICEKLRFWIKAPFVARPGAPMWIYDDGKILWSDSLRQCQITVDCKSITGNVADWLHLCELVLPKPGIAISEFREFAGTGIKQVEG